jgi:hypothetical protein
MMLLDGSVDGEAVVNNLLCYSIHKLRRCSSGRRLLLALEEHMASILHDTLGILLKLLGCGHMCVRIALVLNVDKADVELGEVLISLK